MAGTCGSAGRAGVSPLEWPGGETSGGHHAACARVRRSAACGWDPPSSALGSQLTLVAVSLEVYRLTQDSLYVGLLSIFALVPLVVGGLLGGSIADAHDRRKVALLASVGAVADHRLPGAAGLAAAGQRLGAVRPGGGAERCAGHQPAGPQRHHPDAGPQGAPARRQRPEHDDASASP